MTKLTPREREVLRAIKAGLTSSEVARTIGVSTRTIEFHRSNIRRKLGARTTAEAVAYRGDTTVEPAVTSAISLLRQYRLDMEREVLVKRDREARIQLIDAVIKYLEARFEPTHHPD